MAWSSFGKLMSRFRWLRERPSFQRNRGHRGHKGHRRHRDHRGHRGHKGHRGTRGPPRERAAKGQHRTKGPQGLHGPQKPQGTKGTRGATEDTRPGHRGHWPQVTQRDCGPCGHMANLFCSKWRNSRVQRDLPRNFIQSEVSIHATCSNLNRLQDRFKCGC